MIEIRGHHDGICVIFVDMVVSPQTEISHAALFAQQNEELYEPTNRELPASLRNPISKRTSCAVVAGQCSAIGDAALASRGGASCHQPLPLKGFTVLLCTDFEAAFGTVDGSSATCFHDVV